MKRIDPLHNLRKAARDIKRGWGCAKDMSYWIGTVGIKLPGSSERVTFKARIVPYPSDDGYSFAIDAMEDLAKYQTTPAEFKVDTDPVGPASPA